METPAVLRVKRKRGGSSPAEALVLACKRFRSEAGSAAEASSSSPGEGEVEKTLFKLVATVNSEAEPVDKYIQEAFTQQKGGQILRPALGSAERIIQDLRSSKQAARQESRYRLVASLRPNLSDGKNAALKANEKESDGKKQSSMPEKDKNDSTSGCSRDFQFFDIIQEDVENDTPASHLQKSDPDVILCNAVEMIRERLTVSDNSKEAEDCLNKEEYVYDIYCAETAAPGWIKNILSVQPYTQEFDLVDEEPFAEETYEDEDDENNENNWRNDYPDEEEFLDEDEESEKSGGTSDEDCGYIRRSWEKYESEVLQEFEYDGMKELDSE